MRQVFKKVKDFLWTSFIVAPGLCILPLILLAAYLIATSDLPDWLKFFLLR